MSRLRGAVAAVIAFASSAPARADDDASSHGVHQGMAALEASLLLALPAAAYWATAERQSLDWTIEWDWSTWRDKLLTLDHLRFDANPFTVNAFRHAGVGVVNYHVGRTNGLRMGGALMLTIGTAAVWEYLIEFKENPSVNDMIVNSAAGIAIGEPLWQLGQLWRGGRMTLADRVRTALFSPLDALHDTYRDPPRRRPRAWRSIELGAGPLARVEDGATAQLVGDADLEVVSLAARATDAVHDGSTKPGAWNRIHGQLRFGTIGGEARLTGSFLHSRTSLAGRYLQSGSGTGVFLGVGAAFTYRRERLSEEWDRLGIAHLPGPQIQVLKRTVRHALIWDAAVHGDLAMTHAIVFGPVSPFPRPPPRITALQTDGYYHAIGLSAITRLRAATGPWGMDVEVEGHRMSQLAIADRYTRADVAELDEPVTANGTRDWRLFARGKLSYQPGRLGFAAMAEGAYRRGTGDGRVRELLDLTVGLVVRIEL